MERGDEGCGGELILTYNVEGILTWTYIGLIQKCIQIQGKSLLWYNVFLLLALKTSSYRQLSSHFIIKSTDGEEEEEEYCYEEYRISWRCIQERFQLDVHPTLHSIKGRVGGMTVCPCVLNVSLSVVRFFKN